MSSFFTGGMPAWGSPATGSGDTISAGAKAWWQRKIAMGAYASAIRGLGNPDDYDSFSDWAHAASIAGAAGLQAFHEAGGVGSPGDYRPGHAFGFDTTPSAAAKTARPIGQGQPPPAPVPQDPRRIAALSASRSGPVLGGQPGQPPYVGSPQNTPSRNVRAMLQQRLTRRFPGQRY